MNHLKKLRPGIQQKTQNILQIKKIISEKNLKEVINPTNHDISSNRSTWAIKSKRKTSDLEGNFCCVFPIEFQFSQNKWEKFCITPHVEKNKFD